MTGLFFAVCIGAGPAHAADSAPTGAVAVSPVASSAPPGVAPATVIQPKAHAHPKHRSMHKPPMARAPASPAMTPVEGQKDLIDVIQPKAHGLDSVAPPHAPG